MAAHSIVNNNHDNVVNERQNVDERILSQKMSQLLTKNITDKKLCFINNIQYEINTTPSWLTKQNISFHNNEQHGYQPTTLQQNDHGRYAYLPTFPTESIHLNDYLLLANVPGAFFS
ncbi:unnamed protein product [Rotaria magnacalcarata]|uniref:Uncharacterized protein n=1 Tax=Rotaria magnacalcarata TaxID=392030 RepID=A0A8S2ZZF3_9BILA|nr:unnamed protein product [Rotaria magnacalcarata]